MVMLGAGLLAGCAQFPELDAAATPGVADAPYPQLVPLEDLLTAPETVRAVPEAVPEVTSRVDGLRSRADRLKSVRVSQPVSTPARVAELRARAAALRAQ